MNVTKLKVAILFLPLFFISVLAQSQAATYVVPNVVTTAVPFLRISPDARSGAMGEAGIGLSPDANSGFWDLGKSFCNNYRCRGFNIYAMVAGHRIRCLPRHLGWLPQNR